LFFGKDVRIPLLTTWSKFKMDDSSLIETRTPVSILNEDICGVPGRNLWLYVPDNKFSLIISKIDKLSEIYIVYSISQRPVMQTPSSLLSHVDDPLDRFKIELYRKEVAEVIKQAFIKFRLEIKCLE